MSIFAPDPRSGKFRGIGSWFCDTHSDTMLVKREGGGNSPLNHFYCPSCLRDCSKNEGLRNFLWSSWRGNLIEGDDQ